MPLSKIREHGFHVKFAWCRWGVQWGALGALLPKILRRCLRLVLSRELDAVLDASGFAYADQWPHSNLESLVYLAGECRQNGTRLIFLPQAFGPFSDERRRVMMRESAAAASLIFARDAASLDFLRELCGPCSKLRLAPDFTNLVSGLSLDGAAAFKEFVALVPNRRMLDKSSEPEVGTYIDFMVELGKHVSSLGYRVVVVVHELQLDSALGSDIAARIDGAKVLSEQDPERLKAIFGACRCVISSRYHAIIAALSQGVPAFGTSWSHKYPALFSEYEFSEGLLSTADLQGALRAVGEVLSEPRNQQLRDHLENRAAQLREQSRQMWTDVFHALGPPQ